MYEASIERHDKSEAPERATRIRWLNSVMPRESSFAMQVESYMVFSDAKDAFIYGQYVATILLASSFVEHWLGAIVAANGSVKVQRNGLAAIISYCREQCLLPAALCSRADSLRKIRNPFVHLKSFDHPDTVTQRSIEQQRNPFELLEPDARDSLITMYSVAMYAKGQI